ncbi:hypothetical protein NP493_389g02010 [Ridgeia piscesae]|uniref:Dihydroorotate dehydrogenase (quinone), mitochondrial n=1 Tax=Ridgeia piscesae TaxID=27915 RepID=A0AAD9L1F6_RIDPI|nr:hypothetical protein NP493_389g02010 [Ridgeia piscesae]
MGGLSRAQKIKSGLQIVIGGHLVAAGIATYIGNEKWYQHVVMPTLRLLQPETAHSLAVKCAKHGIIPQMKTVQYESLKTTVWGKQFENPIGLAAGFDKNGEAVDGMLKMGFGFVEVGSITPQPQPGNPKPRMFRLTQDQAIINRCGFNSDGHDTVYDRLRTRLIPWLGPVVPDDRNMLNENLWSPDRPTIQGKHVPAPGIVGVNLGKNKDTKDAAVDYIAGVKKFGELADYLVINVSSPNTPGLRALQGKEQLTKLIDQVLAERAKLSRKIKPPLLVKISPDLTEQDKADVAFVVGRYKGGVEGLIVSNTTVARSPSLKSRWKGEEGGLSGAPLKEKSTQTIRDMYRLTQGRIPIIGVGGISTGQDAYEKFRAGASLIQVYSALSFAGPPLLPKMKAELAEILEKEGITSISEVVGADLKTESNHAVAA